MIEEERKRGLVEERPAHRDAILLRLRRNHRSYDNLLRYNEILTRRRHADPALLDAETRGVAVFDVLAGASSRRHEDERDRKKENAEPQTGFRHAD